MVKKIKKGTKGEVTQFISRAKCLKKLQLKLQDFRRLCILKGIYPREPNKKKASNLKTYYHVKDIKFLQHERLLDKFREIQAYTKKYRRAVIRGDTLKAEHFKATKPVESLNHLVRERYPTFVDALRDLDDPLCLVNLFAMLQSHKFFEIPRERIQMCMRLSREFNLYVISSKSLRKTFLSIKGIYYQAEIQGQLITWLQPYQFNQNLPADVDYRVMKTFLEFYEVLLKFTNFKLFSTNNLQYPPQINTNLEEQQYQSYQSLFLQKKKEDEDNQRFQISEEFQEAYEVKQIENKVDFPGKNLFKGLVFFLNREVPQYSLEFVILSFGGNVHWDGDNSDIEYDSESITHVIVDRDPKHIKFFKNREYVQPQWVYDCINNACLLQVKEYAPGKILPPHLSPFVDNKKEGHIPQRQIQIDQYKGVNNNVIQQEQQDEKEESQQQDDDDDEAEFDVVKDTKKKKIQKKNQQAEEKELAKSMLTKKNRYILNKMEFGENRKKEAADKLKQKAKAIKKNKSA